jgi:hypothetical protein
MEAAARRKEGVGKQGAKRARGGAAWTVARVCKQMRKFFGVVIEMRRARPAPLIPASPVPRCAGASRPSLRSNFNQGLEAIHFKEPPSLT